jgi:hypothetical protein
VIIVVGFRVSFRHRISFLPASCWQKPQNWAAPKHDRENCQNGVCRD